MKHKFYVMLSLFLAMASVLLCSSAPFQPAASPALEPIDSHSVGEALNHALAYVEKNYDMPNLSGLTWVSSADNHPDTIGATHLVFTNKAETLGELQAAYATNPDHAGFTTGQVTVYVHAPDDARNYHKITIIDAQNHTQWSGTIDIDGHCYEYKFFK